MECWVEDPPVLDPFLGFIGCQASGEQPGQLRKLELLKVARLAGHHFPGQLSVGDGHLWHWAEPGDAHLAVLPDGVVDGGHDVGADVVAAQRHWCLLVFAQVVVHDVANEEAVRLATEALGTKRPLKPPWPPPQYVQEPGGLP